MGAVLAVTSAKGGVGKSVFAANFAVALLRETGGRVALLDLDLGLPGDAALALGMPAPRHALTELVPLLSTLSPQAVAGHLDGHHSGLFVLKAFHRPEEAGILTEQALQAGLDLLGQAFDGVVVDLATGYGPGVQACLDRSSHVFVLLTPDVLAINHTARGLALLQQLAVPREAVSLVLNRVEPKGQFTPEVVSARLRRDLAGAIPDAADVFARAILKGEPVILAEPKHPAAKAFDELASALWARGVAGPGLKLSRLPGPAGGSPRPAQGVPAAVSSAGAAAPAEDTETDRLKLRLHERLLKEVDLKQMDVDARDPDKVRRVREETRIVIDRLLDEEAQGLTDREKRRRLSQEVLDEALGLGPLERLLADETVTEIMCNGSRRIYAERKGKLTLTGLKFLSDKQLRATIERIVAPLGRRIDELSPMVDARLSDGSRVNAIIPPLSVDGPALTIRKFAATPLVVPDLIRFGSLNDGIARLLECCVKSRLNVIISGGTGSGKTTLLNVLSSFIPADERIVTIEDSCELQLKQPHVVRLETRPPSLEGTGEVTIRDLVKNALRMRPDRIVVGECRGAEALDMLQAMNTGHDGSLTTVHANNPRDAVRRLETLVMFAGFDLPARAIREQVASSINLIIQQTRLPDGSRKIVSITELTGMEGDVITMQDIFSFHQTGLDDQGRVQGRFVASGFIPRFMTTLEEKGFPVPREIFLESY